MGQLRLGGALLTALGLMLAVAGCLTRTPGPMPVVAPPENAPATPAPRPADPFPVMLGIDVLEAQGFAAIAGRRVGLLSHGAAVNRAGEPTWLVLHRSPLVKLTALFAPEHGFDGKAPASELIRDQVHQPTGLTIYSLYGRTRRPTPAMLALIDVMVVDLQDIGSRSYTFAAAMRETMEACLAAGIEVVVLDRPNPLGGRKVDGPMVDPEWRSYVGAFPVPYVHGLTIGELARLALSDPTVLNLDDAARAAARLTVVPMRGWKRSMRWPDTGLTWRPTSYYVPDFAAVEGYAITGLGCQLGEWKHGVGRDHPFRGLYYRGRTAEALARELTNLGIPGLTFRKIDVLNAQNKQVQGVLVDISDWDALRPTELSFHLMRLECAWSGRNPFRTATRSEMQVFNRHVGSTEWWNTLVRDGARTDVQGFVERWAGAAQAFRERSRAVWLYPDDPTPFNESAP